MNERKAQPRWTATVNFNNPHSTISYRREAETWEDFAKKMSVLMAELETKTIVLQMSHNEEMESQDDD